MPLFSSIWCDGACPNNGNGATVAGWGVWAPRHPYRHKRRQSGRVACTYSEGTSATNNKAELTAMIKALETALEIRQWMYNDYALFICYISTDSSYVKDCMDKWSEKWNNNGWLSCKNQPVKNKELIQEVLRLRKLLVSKRSKVYIVKVDREDNARADALANQGCRMDSDSDSGYITL